MDRKVLRNLSYGVYVVTSKENDKKVGCIANSIMQVTSNPSTIAVSINHDNYTNRVTFGFKTSKDNDKFKDVSYKEEDGIPVITDSCGYMICNVIDVMETETHTVFLGEVVSADDYSDENPMTYKYYHEKLKGSSPKNAPTYEEKQDDDKKLDKKTKKWKCKICGYVYEGDTVPEDFVCPICGQPHTEFYEIED